MDNTWIKNTQDINKLSPDKNEISVELTDDHPKLEFPNWIKSIYIKKYKHNLDNLPNSLTTLCILENSGFQIGEKDKLPENLEELYLYEPSENIMDFPDSLKILRINNAKFPITKLPPKLHTLILSSYNFLIDENITNVQTLDLQNYKLSIDNLSDNIKNLTLQKCHQKINKLPKNLEKLTLDDYYFLLDIVSTDVTELMIQRYNYSLDNISNKIKKLMLDRIDNNISFDNLPINLEELILVNLTMNKHNFLPVNLKKLTIYYSLFPDLFDNLPDNLENIYITCPNFWDYNFTINNLPSRLKSIEITTGLLGYTHTKQKIKKFEDDIKNILGDKVIIKFIELLYY